ncbi:MAG: phospholipid-binding protein [Pseudonocardiaceae bacterium]|nr:phospholipid-binding protein [Pseudonocardiaceae bacterium]
MNESEQSRAPGHHAARLRRVLAEDSRTAELGVQITVEGAAVHLAGPVASGRHKDELDRVLREAAPEMRVYNDVWVVEADEPGSGEELR